MQVVASWPRRSDRLYQSPFTVMVVFLTGLMAGHTLRLGDWLSYSSLRSSNESDSSASARARSASDFSANNAMSWKVPAHIAKQRYDECLGREVSATGGFCLTNTTFTGGNEMYDRPMADFLAHSVFKDQTVVDLGAGLGHYGKIFREPGSPVKAWVGYDGAINVDAVTEGLVRFMDLTQPDGSDERPCIQADWVMSLEVAEHIPVMHTDAYLRNIRCHARVGAVISWALLAQNGLGHVNTRSEEDAVATVEMWGFKADWELTKQVREAASIHHFKRTPVVYRVVNG